MFSSAMSSGFGTTPVTEITSSGDGAPGDDRRQLGGVEPDLVSKCAPSSRMQRLPVAQRHVPGRALRRARAALDVVEGLLVRRDQAGAGAAFDRHVADRHAAFHRQRADRFAGIFDDIAGAAGGADLADDGEDDVLGGDAGRQLAVDAHACSWPSAGSASGSRAHARPRTCRCRAPARRTRHGSRCGCRRRRWSCRAA